MHHHHAQQTAAVLALSLVLLTLPASPAHAYIDPGSGALMVQALLASILGTGIAMRRSLRRVLGRLGLARGEDEQSENGDPPTRG